jgi:hypothetical protein
LNEVLSRRRLKMLRMLARGYSPSAVVEALSKEYNCSAAAICRDNARLNVWAHVVGQDMESTIILRTILNEANGEALKVTAAQIGLIQELGLLGRKRWNTKEKLSVATPFEADPMLREALLESIAKQKAEKVERDAAKPSDASRR